MLAAVVLPGAGQALRHARSSCPASRNSAGASNGRRPAGVSWEVYGDPAEAPAQTRTDIYFLLEPAAG